jgi:hypothetical protein
VQEETEIAVVRNPRRNSTVRHKKLERKVRSTRYSLRNEIDNVRSSRWKAKRLEIVQEQNEARV